MNCEQAREQLWPLERPKVADDATLAARRHLESCRDCEEFFAMDRALQERLRAIRLPPAPASVRERVFDALAAERGSTPRPGHQSAESPGRTSRAARPRRWARSFNRWAVGAAAASVAVLGVWALANQFAATSDTPGPDGPAGDLFIGAEAGAMEEFVRRASQEERLVSSNAAQVAEFLHQRVGIRIDPLGFDGFELVAGEVCVVDDKRGAVLVYERNGQMLYHYVFEHGAAEARAPALSESAPLRWSGSTVPSVVIWSDGIQDQALVGDVTPHAILALARRKADG